MATGSLIAAYTVVDGYGVKMLGIQPVLLDWFSNLIRFFMLAPLVLSKPARAMDVMQDRWLLAIGRRSSIAALVYTRADRSRYGRATKSRRPRTRNVDDGRSDIWNAHPA